MDYWQEFVKTGHVADYLNYKLREINTDNKTIKKEVDSNDNAQL